MMSHRRAFAALSLVGLGIAPVQFMGAGAAHAATHAVAHRTVGTPPVMVTRQARQGVGYTAATAVAGGTTSSAVDLNDSGQLLFQSAKGPAVMTGHAVSVLSAPGFSSPSAWGIDNSGAVYGLAYKGTEPNPYTIQYLRWTSASSTPAQVCADCASGQYVKTGLVSPGGTEVITFGHNLDSFAHTAVGSQIIPTSSQYDGVLYFNGVSDTGTIVGYGSNPMTGAETAYASTKGSFTALTMPAGMSFSSATAISPNGKYIVGEASSQSTNATEAVAWDAHGKVKVLASSLSAFTPVAVNNSGVVLGQTNVWKNGVIANLSKQVSLPKGKTICDAVAINAAGQIAANECSASGTTAVRLTPKA